MLAFLRTLALDAIPKAGAQQPYGSFRVTGWAYSDRLFTDILLNVITMLKSTITMASVAVFIIGAFMFTISAGDENRKSKGKNMMVGSLIGLGIVWGAQAILKTTAYFIWG